MRRVPYVNFAVIAMNILIYVVTDVFGRAALGGFGDDLKREYMLDPSTLTLSQFFSYQFLHGDLLHLLGNMWFLWIFGNSVNSKMGNTAYLLFYLSAGVFAGVGFALTSQNPCIGASGAIAGVTTAFLVLFPHSRITMFYWMWFYVGTWQIKAMVIIVLKIILWDNIISPGLSGGAIHSVAYEAHIAGYLFGFAICFALLLLRALPRDQYDILALAKRYYQRQQLRAVMADPQARARAVYGRVAVPVDETGVPKSTEPSPQELELLSMRSMVSELIAKNEFEAAVDAFERLLSRDTSQVLPRLAQIAIANQLKTMGRYPQAAAAYEAFLRAYPRDAEAPRVKLMLGIIYAKYLDQNEAAEPFLRESVAALTDPDQRDQASQWLEVVLSALGRGGTSPAS